MAELNANSSDALTYRYIYGPGVDRPVARWSSGGLDYYYYDGQGSVIGMAGASTTEKYSYDPYGKPDNDSGNVYRYTGRRLDAETGYYYYRARYYDPDIGRFLSADPIGYGDGLNMYRYAANSPLNFRDPSGTEVCEADPASCTSTVTVTAPRSAVGALTSAHASAPLTGNNENSSGDGSGDSDPENDPNTTDFGPCVINIQNESANAPFENFDQALGESVSNAISVLNAYSNSRYSKLPVGGNIRKEGNKFNPATRFSRNGANGKNESGSAWSTENVVKDSIGLVIATPQEFDKQNIMKLQDFSQNNDSMVGLPIFVTDVNTNVIRIQVDSKGKIESPTTCKVNK